MHLDPDKFPKGRFFHRRAAAPPLCQCEYIVRVLIPDRGFRHFACSTGPIWQRVLPLVCQWFFPLAQQWLHHWFLLFRCPAFVFLPVRRLRCCRRKAPTIMHRQIIGAQISRVGLPCLIIAGGAGAFAALFQRTRRAISICRSG